MTFRSSCGALLLAAIVAVSAAPALAAGSHGGGHHHGEMSAAGQPGSPAEATRTVEVMMRDNSYEPASITVEAGETVRFVVHNRGELVHEFNIGTSAMHKAHQGEMMEMMEHGVLLADRIDHKAAKAMQKEMGHGMHNDPNSVLLEPGGTGEVYWTFPESGEIEFACNVPGHYEAGMHGEFEIR